jgi:hypothetical protein
MRKLGTVCALRVWHKHGCVLVSTQRRFCDAYMSSYVDDMGILALMSSRCLKRSRSKSPYATLLISLTAAVPNCRVACMHKFIHNTFKKNTHVCLHRRMAIRGLRASLLAWRGVCEHRAWHLAVLERVVLKRSSTICDAVLAGWAEVVVAERVKRRGVVRLHARRELRLLHLHFTLWHQAVVENR